MKETWCILPCTGFMELKFRYITIQYLYIIWIYIHEPDDKESLHPIVFMAYANNFGSLGEYFMPRQVIQCLSV